MLENMNLNADPCEDFYEFTCGGFDANTRLGDSESARTTFGNLNEKLMFSVIGQRKIVFFS